MLPMQIVQHMRGVHVCVSLLHRISDVIGYQIVNHGQCSF